ncbi:MAG: glucose 1-dehydrogenase [Patescibacteria group bacterium]|nr:glucose 1-dehydrogenase [Patescibacteria group bacterium]
MAIATLFAKEGAKVCISGRRQEIIEKAVVELRQSGADAMGVNCDVSEIEQVNGMVEKTIAQFGKLDILVNNAGVYIGHDAVSATEEEWDKVVSIDLKGVWLCSKTVLPHMITQGKGKIINVASIAGLVGFAGSAFYCAAKGAVINLTREMALDYALKNININVIAPGVIDTDMTKPFLEDEQAKKGFLATTPLGKIGKPEDIGWGAVYLASDESDFVTGHTLVIDGGWVAK